MAGDVPEWNMFQIGTVERFRVERGGLPACFVGDDGLHGKAGEQNPDRQAQVPVQGEGGHQREDGIDAKRPEETSGHVQFILAYGTSRDREGAVANFDVATAC